MGSTCNYNVYSYHDQHARGFVEDKYDVYNKYSGVAPGPAGAWQQPQLESAYGSYACHNQSQYARHDGSAWVPSLLQEHGQHNVRDEQAAYTGQYATHDGSAWLPSPRAKYGQHSVRDVRDVRDDQAAFHGQYERPDWSAWLSSLLAEFGQENVPDEKAAYTGQDAKHDGSAQLSSRETGDSQHKVNKEQAAYTGQDAKHDGSAQLSSRETGDSQHKVNKEQAAYKGLCYTEKEGTGTKRLIETLATVGGKQGDGAQADEQDRSAKMRKLYDPGNVQPLDDYDVEDSGLGFGIGDPGFE
jgi:hypothetical protein